EVAATPSVPPPVPTGFSASPGNAQVSLSWTASAGAARYDVYRGTLSGGEGTTPVASVTATSTVQTGLSNGTLYYFTVAAVNSGGWSSAQPAEAGARPVAPPAAPTGVTATPGAGKVTLSWNVSTGATGYDVFQGTTPGGEGAAPVLSGAARTVAVTGLS